MPNSDLQFNDLLDQFMTYYNKEKYQQALDILQKHGPLFPEQQPQLMAWQAAMLSRLGRAGEALHLLEEAYNLGHWYNEGVLNRDPDFAALQELPGYADLKQRMAARRTGARSGTLPDLKVFQPETPAPYRLLLALHGNQGNIGLTEDKFQSPVSRGWLVALPQSSQPGWSSGVFVWDDVTRAMTEAKTHLADLTARYAIAPKAVVATGFSMGAHVALRMALDPAFNLRGVVAVEAWFTPRAMTELAEIIQAAPISTTRFVLIAGRKNEEYYNMAVSIRDMLTARGFHTRLVAASNSQHGYPPELPSLIDQSLAWILA